MPDIRTALAVIVGVVMLGLGGLVWLLSERLDTTTRQLQTATSKLQGLVVGLAELEKNIAAAAARDVVVVDTRDTIVSASPEKDGDLAPVMFDAFRGVDQLGAMP